MYKPIQVRNLTLGEGRPKICVPIVGRSLTEILAQAEGAVPLNPDLCEWRADWFQGARDGEKLLAAARAVREALPALPLLFTFRTKGEGGSQELPAADYLSLCRRLAASGCCDLIDLELYACGEALPGLIREARSAGVLTVVSNHDFEKTPSENELLRRLREMEAAGADLPKIAVMPQSPADVLTLLNATLKMRETSSRPIITMSMGRMGAVSRACGELFGSCLTFGSASRTSAPGQIPVPELRRMLDAFGGLAEPVGP